jgi:hypothetical protein
MLRNDLRKMLNDLTTVDITQLLKQVSMDKRLANSEFKDLRPDRGLLRGGKEENIRSIAGWYTIQTIQATGRSPISKQQQILVQVFDERLRDIWDKRNKTIFGRALERTHSSKSSHYYKPDRDDVDVTVWQERDRLHISVDYKHGKMPASPLAKRDIADWWDEDASQMFEDGFFKPMGPMGEKDPKFINSVLEYCEQMGILRK